MYLNKKTYVSMDERDNIEIKNEKFDKTKIKYIIEEAGYWRKANHIHRWFVENVQDNDDTCKDYYVDPGKLKELLALVEAVLANHKLAEKLLPTQEGFFFGGTEYDEYYFEDLEDTKKILEEAIKDEHADYYYSSSW